MNGFVIGVSIMSVNRELWYEQVGRSQYYVYWNNDLLGSVIHNDVADQWYALSPNHQCSKPKKSRNAVTAILLGNYRNSLRGSVMYPGDIECYSHN
jgi:hypothetical protein